MKNIQQNGNTAKPSVINTLKGNPKWLDHYKSRLGSRISAILDRRSTIFHLNLKFLKQSNMTLKEKINKDYIEAFKAKNTVAKNLLSVIKGEIQTIEKNTSVENLSDEDVTKILNKTVKSLKETLTSLSDTAKISATQTELKIVESYLPTQLSVEEIQSKIDALVASGVKNLGMIMKEFNSLPVDKKVVSELVKKAIV
jgi:uncharacterized protein YqeY